MKLALAGTIAAMGTLISGVWALPRVEAQSKVRLVNADRIAFDIVSIKRSSELPATLLLPHDPATLQFKDVPLISVIGFAYQTPIDRIHRDTQSNVLSTRYDITGKSDHALSVDEARRMVQTLLEDRFKLTVKHESRTESIYKLVVGKSGPQFHTLAGSPSRKLGKYDIRLEFRRESMSNFCTFLQGLTYRPVLDETALEGVYDFELVRNLEPRDRDASVGVELEFAMDSVKKLGLQLKSGERKMDVLVIKHVEKPKAM